MATKESKNLASKTPTSKVVLDVSGYMTELTPINRRYHLRQVVDSNLPNASVKILEAIQDSLLASFNSKKHLDACRVVVNSVNNTGEDIIIKIFKNLWISSDGMIVNNPTLKVEEKVDYLREYVINRSELITYTKNPGNLAPITCKEDDKIEGWDSVTKVYRMRELIKSYGKGTKQNQPAGGKV